jgi:PAP2 superfamily.
MSFLTMLQEIRTPFWNQFFLFCTNFGQELFCLAVLCGLFWCVDKKLAYKLGFAFFVSGLFVQLLKISFRTPRPWVRDESIVPVNGAKQHATGYSFPSGHTQISTALFSTLLFHTKRKALVVLCSVMIFLVGFSRLYLGVHTPLDVIVSFLLTITISAGIAFFFERLYAEKHIFVVSFGMCLLSVILAGYSVFLLKQGLIKENYVTDCFKAAGAGIGFGIGYYLERTHIHFNEKCKNRFLQVVKFVVGLVGVFGIKTLLTLTLGRSLPADLFRYCLMSLWAIALYPALIKKISKQT